MILLNAFMNMFDPLCIVAMVFGVAWGILLGAMPGFGGVLAMALLLPFTYGMDPNIALPMLTAVYSGAIYGGGITAILLGVPGTSAAAATVADGFAMTKKGESNKALTVSLFSSSIGGAFSGFVLLLFAPLLAKMTILFGPAEFFMLAVFGLAIIASLSGESLIKGLMTGVFGLLLGTIGIEPLTGESRFTFAQAGLYDGMPLIPMILSMFAFPRVLMMMREAFGTGPVTLSGDIKGGGPKAKFRELFGLWKPILRSSIIGSMIGIIPGAGSNIACWVGYSEAKRKSKTPEKYGTGIPEGVAAAEAANNAVEGGSMVPLLTLSIPGNAGAAIMLGALLIHGMVPGMELFTKYAPVTYTYIMAVIFCNVILFAVGWYTSFFFAKMADIPYVILAPSMLLITLLGAFSTREYLFDVWITVGFGVLFYLLTRVKFPIAPALLGFILGPISEAGYRRAMLINHGDWSIFFTRPICIVLILLSVFSIYSGLKMSKTNKKLNKK